MATKKKKQRFLSQELEKMEQANALLRTRVSEVEKEAEDMLKKLREAHAAELKKLEKEKADLEKELAAAKKAKKPASEKKSSKKKSSK